MKIIYTQSNLITWLAIFKKLVCLQIHKLRPELSQHLAHQMSHSETTAKSIYNCIDSTRNSSEVTKEVRWLQFKVFLKLF